MRLIPHGSPATLLVYPALRAAGVPQVTTTRHFPGLRAWSSLEPPFEPAAHAALAVQRLDLTRASWLRQVHGAEVVRAGAGGGYAGVADVLVTTERAAPLAVFTADCMAITLADAEGGALALAHVGWRGAAGGAIEAAVDALAGAGGRIDRVRAAVSPSIGPCCYEVDAPVRAAFAGRHASRVDAWMRPGRPDHWMLDLWAIAGDLLTTAGVPVARVENPRLCTACHLDLFFSYRKGNRGRLATIAALPG